MIVILKYYKNLAIAQGKSCCHFLLIHLMYLRSGAASDPISCFQCIRPYRSPPPLLQTTSSSVSVSDTHTHTLDHTHWESGFPLKWKTGNWMTLFGAPTSAVRDTVERVNSFLHPRAGTRMQGILGCLPCSYFLEKRLLHILQILRFDKPSPVNVQLTLSLRFTAPSNHFISSGVYSF